MLFLNSFRKIFCVWWWNIYFHFHFQSSKRHADMKDLIKFYLSRQGKYFILEFSIILRYFSLQFSTENRKYLQKWYKWHHIKHFLKQFSIWLIPWNLNSKRRGKIAQLNPRFPYLDTILPSRTLVFSIYNMISDNLEVLVNLFDIRVIQIIWTGWWIDEKLERFEKFDIFEII